MAYLVDTSVLGRLVNTSDVLYATADQAVTQLRLRGESLHVTSQNLIEFRSVATRPADVNGLGMSLSEVEGAISDLEKAFPLLPDIPAIFRAWKTLVVAAAVLGRQVHDARHVAVCQAYGLSQILTFDDSHFTRLVSFTPPTVVIHPSAI